MLVHAQDEDARRVYLKHGLEPSPTDPLHLDDPAQGPRGLKSSSHRRIAPACTDHQPAAPPLSARRLLQKVRADRPAARLW